MSTWVPPHVGPNWGNPLLVSPRRACRFHPTLILSTSMLMFLGEFTLLAICSHIFQIPTFWGQLLLESWKLVCVILSIWFPIWHKRNPRWGVHPKSKHTHFLCLNFHFLLSPPSCGLHYHSEFILGPTHPGHHAKQRLYMHQQIVLSRALRLKFISPMWDMSCEFMHYKFYFSDWECIILLACTTFSVLLNWDLGIFYLWIQHPSPFPLVSIAMPFPTISSSHWPLAFSH